MLTHGIYSFGKGFAFGNEMIMVSKKAFDRFLLIQEDAMKGNCDQVRSIAQGMLEIVQSEDAPSLGRMSDYVKYRIDVYSQGSNRDLELSVVQFRLNATKEIIDNFLSGSKCGYSKRTHDFYTKLFYFLVPTTDKNVWFMDPARSVSLELLEECAESPLFDAITTDPFYLPRLNGSIPPFEYYGVIDESVARGLKTELEDVLPTLQKKFPGEGEYFISLLQGVTEDEVIIIHHE